MDFVYIIVRVYNSAIIFFQVDDLNRFNTKLLCILVYRLVNLCYYVIINIIIMDGLQ